MAGSYNHCVEKPSGKLLINRQLQGMLECCSGDVYEAIQEMYGMIWWMAEQLTLGNRPDYGLPGGNWTKAEWVERARQQYKYGLDVSPGIDGRLEDEDDGL